jgi:hypothetical protein
MAIDLFCYAAHEKNDVAISLKHLVATNQALFSQKFLVSDPRRANAVHREIASEFGLNAHSLFLIRVNDKSAAGHIPEVATAVKGELGKDKVVILMENEKLIE